MREKLYDYYNVIFEPELIEDILQFGTFKNIKKENYLLTSIKSFQKFL